MPAFAVVLGVLADWSIGSVRSRTTTSSLRLLGGLIVAVLIGFGGRLVVATADDLSSTDRVELRQLGRAVELRLPVETAVVFDPTGDPLGSFDTRRAPLARYTVPGRDVFMAEVFVWLPDRADGIGTYAITTNGEVLDVDGWSAETVSSAMTLYVSDENRSGAPALGSDLIEFGEAHDGSNGSMLRLAGAIVLIHNDLVDAGCAAIRSLWTDDPTFDATIRSALVGVGGDGLVDRCTGAS